MNKKELELKKQQNEQFYKEQEFQKQFDQEQNMILKNQNRQQIWHSRQAQDMKQQKRKQIDIIMDKLKQAEQDSAFQECMDKQYQLFIKNNEQLQIEKNKKSRNYVERVLRKKIGIKPKQGEDGKFEAILEEFRNIDSFFDVGDQIKKVNVLNNQEFQTMLQLISIQEKMKEFKRKGSDSSMDGDQQQKIQQKFQQNQSDISDKSDKSKARSYSEHVPRLDLLDCQPKNSKNNEKKIKKNKDLKEKVRNYLREKKQQLNQDQFQQYTSDFNNKNNGNNSQQQRGSINQQEEQLQQQSESNRQFQQNVINQIKEAGYINNSNEKIPNSTYYNKFLKRTDNIINQAEQKAKLQTQEKFKLLDKNLTSEDFHGKLLRQIKEVRVALESYTFSVSTRKEDNKRNKILLHNAQRKFNPQLEKQAQEKKIALLQLQKIEEEKKIQQEQRFKKYKKILVVKSKDNDNDNNNSINQSNSDIQEQVYDDNDNFNSPNSEDYDINNQGGGIQGSQIFYTNIDYNNYYQQQNSIQHTMDTNRQSQNNNNNLDIVNTNHQSSIFPSFTHSQNNQQQNSQSQIIQQLQQQQNQFKLQSSRSESTPLLLKKGTQKLNPMLPKLRSEKQQQFQLQKQKQKHEQNQNLNQKIPRYRSYTQLTQQKRIESQQDLKQQKQKVKKFIQDLTLQQKLRQQETQDMRGQIFLVKKGFKGQMDKMHGQQDENLLKVGSEEVNDLINQQLQNSHVSIGLKKRKRNYTRGY